MKHLSALFLSAVALMLYTSCSKNDDIQNPDPDSVDATDITNPDDDSFETVRFNNTPQYDSKNRLIKFSTFFDDTELYVTEYTISYYK